MRTGLIVGVVGFSFAVGGCAERRKERVTLAQVVRPERTGVIQPVTDEKPRPHNGYVSLVSGRTEGRFPCALAIARVESPVLPESFADTVRLAMEPANELIDWMELFDDVWSISEVFPVTYPTRTDRAVSPETLVTYAEADGAGLCLIYEITCTGDDGLSIVDVRGSLYDARNGALLVMVHADARVRDVPPDRWPPAPPRDRIEVDRRHVDPWFIAQARFREHVRESMLELAAQDRRTVAPLEPRQRTAADDSLPIKRSPYDRN